MAEEAGTSGECQRTGNQIQQPRDKSVPAAAHRRRGDPRSVLKVSQLLLRAIAAHKGLTLEVLKKELGNAGYEVRRKSGSPGGDASRADTKGALLRVSGSGAANCFRVWKVPKSKRKQRGVGRPEESTRCGKRPPRSPAGQRSPLRAGPTKRQRRTSSKAREAWGPLRPTSRRSRPAVKQTPQQSARSRAAKTKAQASKVGKSRSQETKRPSTKAREEKKKEEPQPAPPAKEDLSRGQAKMHDLRVTRSKTSTKSESTKNASKSPQVGAASPSPGKAAGSP